MSHTFLFSVGPCAIAFVVCVRNAIINFMLEKTSFFGLEELYKNYLA